jgi:hypothetical protein
MSRELIAGQSGVGKSWISQYRIESNAPNFDAVVVLDYCDEYRGLCKAGLAKWLGIGGAEANLTVSGWVDLLRSNAAIVAARAVDAKRWREDVAPTVAKAAREISGDVLVVIDEAHFIARMRKTTPRAVEELATTGRGQGISSLWVTQRLAKLDATVSSQCDRRLLGIFTNPNDIDRIDAIVDYPAEVHNPQKSRIRNLPEELGEGPLQETGAGSEWIYSTRAGEYKRIDSSTLTMESTHYGPEGSKLDIPG